MLYVQNSHSGIHSFPLGIAISGRLASRFALHTVLVNSNAASCMCVRSFFTFFGLSKRYGMDVASFVAATVRLDAIVVSCGASLYRSVATVVRLVTALIKFNEQFSFSILYSSLLDPVPLGSVATAAAK